MKMHTRFWAVCALHSLLLMPAYSQSLKERELDNEFHNFVEAIDHARTTLRQLVDDRKRQCMAAVGTVSVCECLAHHIPPDIDFLEYVPYVSQTKNELHYDELAAEQKHLIDLARAARDVCVKP